MRPSLIARARRRANPPRQSATRAASAKFCPYYAVYFVFAIALPFIVR